MCVKGDPIERTSGMARLNHGQGVREINKSESQSRDEGCSKEMHVGTSGYTSNMSMRGIKFISVSPDLCRSDPPSSAYCTPRGEIRLFLLSSA